MSANADLITMETYVQQGETIWKPVFTKTKNILGYLGGPEGVFNDQTGHILLSSYPLKPYPCTCQIRKQSDKKCLSLNPKYEKYTFFIFVGPEGP